MTSIYTHIPSVSLLSDFLGSSVVSVTGIKISGLDGGTGEGLDRGSCWVVCVGWDGEMRSVQTSSMQCRKQVIFSVLSSIKHFPTQHSLQYCPARQVLLCGTIPIGVVRGDELGSFSHIEPHFPLETPVRNASLHSSIETAQ